MPIAASSAPGSVDAHRQRQTVGDAHDDEHDGEQAGVPERQALAVAHGEAAVDAGEQDEHAGDDADDPGEHRDDVGGGGAQVVVATGGTTTRSARSPSAVNTIEKNMPRASHDVFHALVNGGMARQKRSGRPRYTRCSGQLEQHDQHPAEHGRPPGPCGDLADAGEQADEVDAHAEGGEDLGEPDEQPLPEIHSFWRMGLTIHSCVTIHWRRVCAFMTAPPRRRALCRRCAGTRRGPRC